MGRFHARRMALVLFGDRHPSVADARDAFKRRQFAIVRQRYVFVVCRDVGIGKGTLSTWRRAGAIGRKYKWSPLQRIRAQRSLSNSRTHSQTDKPAPTAPEQVSSYFCSELIAEAYKSMGYLRNDLPSSVYLPGTFAASQNLILLNGGILGPEIRIDFSLVP